MKHGFNCRCVASNTRYTNHKRKHALTVKDVRYARALFKAGFITWVDAMEFLKDVYDENI